MFDVVYSCGDINALGILFHLNGRVMMTFNSKNGKLQGQRTIKHALINRQRPHQRILLIHKPHHRPRLLIAHFPSINPRLPLHLPALVLPSGDIKESRFTRPRGTHDGHNLARQGRAGDGVEDEVRVERVGEGGEVQRVGDVFRH